MGNIDSISNPITPKFDKPLKEMPTYNRPISGRVGAKPYNY